MMMMMRRRRRRRCLWSWWWRRRTEIRHIIERTITTIQVMMMEMKFKMIVCMNCFFCRLQCSSENFGEMKSKNWVAGKLDPKGITAMKGVKNIVRGRGRRKCCWCLQWWRFTDVFFVDFPRTSR